jgi:hypothetical protein
MAALKVNKATLKKYSLKKLAKKKKRIGGGGDGGFITKKIQEIPIIQK